ncbi:MAG TPA: helix-turn-helix transcriptional regulator [Vicinamibacterales bacterium]|jgi:DNA-binding CsgD family transcriptional regulator|nr:helix-turn-helix transcriptional regulator [Vicinamibacterales bacterium]
MDDALQRGRAAYERQAWADAFAALSDADRASPLDAEDLDRLAAAAALIGLDDASAAARTRAFQRFLDRGDSRRAAASAIWRLLSLADQKHRQAEAAGWLARAERLLASDAEDCVERGFLLCLGGHRKASEGDIPGARAAFVEAAAIGDRLRHADLIALARHAEGRAMLWQQQTAAGLARFDEVMVAVTAGEVGPIVTGIVYCSVLSACHDLFDLRRAHEWTDAMTSWCTAHPDMVPFRGQCLVRRSELLQLHGAWDDAVAEARRACERLASSDPTESAAAFYQHAEICRVRGDFEAAEEGYRQASRAGRRPQPGLALLRLAQGDAAAADAAIRSALHETKGQRARALVLHAAVDILLASADLAAARAAAGELAELAERLGAPALRAAVAQAAGAIALAAGEPRDAVGLLREAWELWQDVPAPYEVARVRALMGSAYAALGDDEGARMEIDAAVEVFEHLGARPDVERLSTLQAPEIAAPSGGLTGREVEVLRQIAAGKTNRAIAAQLSISEKTVARHISNIFTKLDLSSRSAATAYAYEHKLL